MVLLFYTTYISVDLAHHKIFCAKVGKGGIIRSRSVFPEYLEVSTAVYVSEWSW